MFSVIVDLDQCLYPYAQVLEAYCIDKGYDYEFDMSRYDFYSPAWSRNRFIEVSNEAVKAGILYQQGIYPEALDFMNSLRAMGHVIQIVTHREFGGMQMAKLATLNWLADYEIPYDSVTFTGKKGTVMADFAIDDNPVYVEDMKRSGTDAWVLAHPYNEDYKGNRVATLSDFLNIIEMQEVVKNFVP